MVYIIQSRDHATFGIGVLLLVGALAALAVGSDAGWAPADPVEETRVRVRALEARLRDATDRAATRGDVEARIVVLPPTITDDAIRRSVYGPSLGERVGEIGKSLTPFGGLEPPLATGPITEVTGEAIYISDRSPVATYRRYRASYASEEIREDDGCSPQIALDPEGALACGLSINPRGRRGSLRYGIAPEWVSRTGVPVLYNASTPEPERHHIATVVRISTSAPSPEGLAQLAADEAYLRRVRLRAVRAGQGSAPWRPGLSEYAAWAELAISAPPDQGAGHGRATLLVGVGMAGRGCARTFSNQDKGRDMLGYTFPTGGRATLRF